MTEPLGDLDRLAGGEQQGRANVPEIVQPDDRKEGVGQCDRQVDLTTKGTAPRQVDSLPVWLGLAERSRISATCLERWMQIADREDGPAAPTAGDGGWGGRCDGLLRAGQRRVQRRIDCDRVRGAAFGHGMLPAA
jgi:hypothetical protein